MGWLDRGDDPLLERVRLDRHGRFVFDRDQPLSFRDANGIHWLLLDSVYSGPPGRDGRGRTVHLVRPGDLDLGGGMDNFAEDLAERIRETDPDAVAIFSYWPQLADVSPADHTCRVRCLSFSTADGPPTSPAAGTGKTPRPAAQQGHLRHRRRHRGLPASRAP